MSTDTLTAGTIAAIETLQPATLVVCVTACTTVDDVARAAALVRDAGRELGDGVRAVVVHPDTAEAGDVAGRQPADAALQLLPCRLPLVGRLPFSATDRSELFRPLLLVTARTGAAACVLAGSEPDGLTAETIGTLAAPVLNDGVDLLMPSYPRHRLDGLINSGIAYPMMRALYARRVDGHLGVDFGFSRRLLEALARSSVVYKSPRPLWLLTEAVKEEMTVGQACLGAWRPPVEPAADVSTTLVQVLGSLFEDMEYHATVWQRTRGSQPVPTFGTSGASPDDARAVDVRAMMESFQIGFRNLQEVWGRVFPPATLIELNRLTRRSPDDFRLPDAVWARIMFDAALAHRLRTISRDHLLRALTPIYLAWVASFALATGSAGPAEARDHLARLCLAYEAEKSYLVARWRWPDRFNP